MARSQIDENVALHDAQAVRVTTARRPERVEVSCPGLRLRGVRRTDSGTTTLPCDSLKPGCLGA